MPEASPAARGSTGANLRQLQRPLAESEVGMKRHTRNRWIGICVFGAALGAAGCSYSVQRPTPDCCMGLPVTLPARAAAKPAGQPGAPPQPGAGTQPMYLPPVTASGATGTRTVAPVPAAAVTAAAGSRFQATATVTAIPGTAPQPVLVADARPVATRKKRPRSRPVLTLDASGGGTRQVAAVAPALPAAPAGEIQRVSYQPGVVEAPGHTPDRPQRRSYVDLTIQQWFGCAEDHSWLNGQVLYARSTNTWRLHYASVDDNDPYGGTVTLVGEEKLKTLKDGQFVRVCGCPVEPDRREADSPYRVTSFKIVEHPQ
jgi:hypothetical protein